MLALKDEATSSLRNRLAIAAACAVKNYVCSTENVINIYRFISIEAFSIIKYFLTKYC
jgi:hypothetical protein